MTENTPIYQTPEKLETRFCPPESFQTASFTNKNGQRIRYGWLIPENAKAVVVVLQGLSEFGEKYIEFMREQAALGRGSIFIDWLYQGGSQRHKGNPHKRHCETFQNDVNDVCQLVDTCLPKCLEAKGLKDLPLILFGHSTGGCLGTMLLQQRPALFKCAALTAPKYRILFPKLLSPIIRGLTHLHSIFIPDSYVYMGGDWTGKMRPDNVADDTLSKDPIRHLIQRQWFLKNPNLQVGHITWHWLDEALKTSARITQKAEMAKVKTPALLVTAGHDWLVDSDYAQNAASYIPNCETHHIEDSYHEILMERDFIRQQFLDRFETLIQTYV